MPQADFFGVAGPGPMQVIPSWDDGSGFGGLADWDISGMQPRSAYLGALFQKPSGG